MYDTCIDCAVCAIVWCREQDELKVRCKVADCFEWQLKRIVNSKDDDDDSDTESVSEAVSVPNPDTRPLTYVGGLDISFVKGDDVNACAAFVVVQLPSLKVITSLLSIDTHSLALTQFTSY